MNFKVSVKWIKEIFEKRFKGVGLTWEEAVAIKCDAMFEMHKMIMLKKMEKEEYNVGMPVMIKACDTWHLRYYAGKGNVFQNGQKNGTSYPWKPIIPVDKFDFDNPNNSIQHDIAK